MLPRILAYIIRLYQVSIGLLFAGSCRYYPTCSEYARQAVLKKGIFKGIAMGTWRILRCNPFSRGGYDPVD